LDAETDAADVPQSLSGVGISAEGFAVRRRPQDPRSSAVLSSKPKRAEADHITRCCHLNELVGCSAWGPDKQVFDVHIIISATHVDENPHFVVTVFRASAIKLFALHSKTK
jgi:hypothetical protein